jgi:hypothetical protein
MQTQQSNYGGNEGGREHLTGAMDDGIVNRPIAAMLNDSLVGVSAMANDNVGCLGSTLPPSPLTSPVSPHCALAANPMHPQAVSLTHDHGHDCKSPLCCLDCPISCCKSWCPASFPSGTHHMCPLQSQPLSPQCWR